MQQFTVTKFKLQCHQFRYHTAESNLLVSHKLWKIHHWWFFSIATITLKMPKVLSNINTILKLANDFRRQTTFPSSIQMIV